MCVCRFRSPIASRESAAVVVEAEEEQAEPETAGKSKLKDRKRKAQKTVEEDASAAPPVQKLKRKLKSNK